MWNPIKVIGICVGGALAVTGAVFFSDAIGRASHRPFNLKLFLLAVALAIVGSVLIGLITIRRRK